MAMWPSSCSLTLGEAGAFGEDNTWESALVVDHIRSVAPSEQFVPLRGCMIGCVQRLSVRMKTDTLVPDDGTNCPLQTEV